MSAIKERIMKKNTRFHPLAVMALLLWIALAASACVTPVQAAGSPTPGPTQSPTATAIWTSTAAPTATNSVTSTAVPLPHPVCTIEWAWRDAGLTITAVDFSRADGLVPGDVILTVNGRDAEAVIVEIETSLGGIGDPDLRRALALDALLYGSDVLLLGVRHGQQPAYYYNLEPGCQL
jgi:hypothetical protein